MEKNAEPNETDPKITNTSDVTCDELSHEYVVVDMGYDNPKTDDKKSNAYFIPISNNSSASTHKTSTHKTSTHNASSDEVINDPKCHDDNKRSNESFYIDLSSISPVSTSTNESLNRSSTKKSIFSMFIDIHDETTNPDQSEHSHKCPAVPDEKIVSCSYPSYSRLTPSSCPLAIKSPKTSTINSSLSPKLSNINHSKTSSAINSVKNSSISESKTSRSSLSSTNSPKAFSLSSSESRGSSMNSKHSPKGPTITVEKSIPPSKSSPKVYSIKQTKNSLPKGPLPLSTTKKSNNYTLYQNKPPQNWLSKYQMTKSDQRNDKRLQHAPLFSKSFERFTNSYEQQSYNTKKSTIRVALDTIESKLNNYQLEDDTYRTDEEIYVKLSDLMRPVASPAKKNDIHMSKSTPGQSLADLRISTISNISFHVENTTSLSRLFPSLSNELSRTSSLSLCSSMYDTNNVRTGKLNMIIFFYL